MKKIGTLVFSAILFISVTSCKKYDDDKFYSTYTVKGRLTKIGNWKLIKILDTSSGKEFIPLANSLLFENNTYSFVGIFSNFQVNNVTQIMKPMMESELLNISDSIQFSTSNKLDYEFNENKRIVVLKEYMESGYLSLPSASQFLTVNKVHDLEFKIKRLEIGDMTLVYKERLYFYYKKIKREP